jgi:hypothetical protein
MANFNVMQASQIIGPFVFVGANSIGPKVTLSLTRVLLTPSKAIEFISDGLANIQLDGMVMIDVVTGSAGTLSEDGDAASPAVTNYYDGKGVVSFNGVDLGNCQKFDYTPDVKVIEHYSQRSGIKTLDFAFVQQRGAKLTVVIDEITTANLMLAMYGVAA